MDYIRKLNLLGGQSGDQAPTGAETIERLVDRVQSSTLIDDRRDAVRALRSLSKKFRIEVGTQAMGVLLHVLTTDRSDAEITGYALDTLCNLLSDEPLGEDEAADVQVPDDIGSQFTEMFIKDSENVGLLLSLLEEYDFHVRWPTVKLITVLLANKCKSIQEIILANPMGISKLMDLLSDSREIIRNDGLLLLIQLTRGNTNIQKIVAFENAFERLIDIVTEEGCSDGGIVVEDCLLLLLNLLKNNSSNQTFFKEGSFIQRLPFYFELPATEETVQEGWSAQKVTNIHLMLQLVRTLVTPSNPLQQIAVSQRVMNTCGLLEKLCTILMASGVPADVLTETINTVSEVIRGNQANQEYFASVMAPSNPPRPAIVVLLMSMVNERQPFVLRCAVLYCFQSFLYKNELGQSQIVQTLLPNTAEVNAVSTGQLLCGGLFSTDPLSTWFAAVALLHSITDNSTQKEQLLRVQLATSLGNPPVSLLQQCTNILAQGGKIQMRVGLLMLLCHWLAHCPVAVTHFLHNTANVPFLISQVSASEGDEMELTIQGLCAFLLGICVLFNNDEVENSQTAGLKQIIEKRIGLETFTDKLSQVSKHESYSRAAKKPQVNYRDSTEVLYDFEFTRLFKKIESDVLRAVSLEEDADTAKARKATLDQHENIVEQYKTLIREQDSQLSAVRAELQDLQSQNSSSQTEGENFRQQVQQLKDQISLLKAQKGSSGSLSSTATEMSGLQETIDSQKERLEQKDKEIEALKAARLEQAGSVDSSGPPEDAALVEAEVGRLKTEQEVMSNKLLKLEEEVRLYKTRYEESSKQVADLRQQMSTGDTGDTAQVAVLEERNSLAARVTELEAHVASLESEKRVLTEVKSTLENKLKNVESVDSGNDEKLRNLEAEKKALEVSLSHAREELETVKKDQEDLLVLLEDQENKIKTYRLRLKGLGQEVEDDEDLEDEDDDNTDENGEKDD